MKVPLSRPYVTEETKEAVLRVLDSGNFILGDECKSFEKELADYFGVKEAILVKSGTAALYLSMRVLGISSGDEILVPSHTAYPTVEAIMHSSVNAVPVFVDISDGDFTLDPRDLESKITEKTKVILPVHLYGCPARMNEIVGIAERNNLYVIEDACQAHGAAYYNAKVGSLSDIATVSFYPSKNLGLYGDGGAVLTDDEEVASKIRKLRNHGRSSRYEHDEVGDNLRFDEIQAAVGRIQLRYLDDFVINRSRLANMYSGVLADTGLILPKDFFGRKHSYHLFVVMLKDKETRDRLKLSLAEHDIGTEIHYPIPAHRQRGTLDYFNAIGRKINDNLPFTDNVVDRILSLPMFPSMKDDEVEYIVNRIKESL